MVVCENCGKEYDTSTASFDGPASRTLCDTCLKAYLTGQNDTASVLTSHFAALMQPEDRTLAEWIRSPICQYADPVREDGELRYTYRFARGVTGHGFRWRRSFENPQGSNHYYPSNRSLTAAQFIEALEKEGIPLTMIVRPTNFS